MPLNKIDINWLSIKGVLRYSGYFLIKILIFTLWGLIILNLIFSHFLNIELKILFPLNLIFILIFFAFNFVFILFAITIFTLTSRIRKEEFGILRALGATRVEVFNLIIKESLFLPIITTILLIILELLFLLYYKLEICGIFKLEYNFNFFKFLFLSAFITFILKIFITGIFLFPIAIYYSRIDPYNILRD